MTGQPNPTQPWPAPHAAQPWSAPHAAQAHAAQVWPATPHAPAFPPGPWAPPAGQYAPAQAPAQFPTAQLPTGQLPTGQFPTGQFPTAQFPPAPGFGGPELGGPWPPPGPGHSTGHPMPAPAPHPARPEVPARRRGPVAMVSVLLLVLLAVGAGVWAVSTGHTPATVGASSGSPLAAPSSPLPANPLGGGDFCQVARDTVAKQGAALNDPNADLTAMLAEARATNRRLAAAAPAELQADFAVFQQVSDQLVAALSGGDPQALQGVATPEFLAAVEHITTYAKTRCGLQLDSLTPPGLGG